MIKAKKGFTLIELLVVVAIIGILAALVISYLGQARLKSRDSRRKSDLKTIYTSLTNYADDNNGNYPANTAALVPNYMAQVPTDPQTSVAYPYAVSAAGTEFEINATLENQNDTDDNNDGGNAVGTYEVGDDPSLDLL
ncbi:prepilin-type N-terminal cleavage/methylation domain-containing protein [bacterium]|nr:prepilin-type N-terminal cleavage/methylation domain-containing protein [bacterium]